MNTFRTYKYSTTVYTFLATMFTAFGFDVLRIFLSHLFSGSQPKVESNVKLKS